MKTSFNALLVIDITGEPSLIFEDLPSLINSNGLYESYIKNISNLGRCDTIIFLKGISSPDLNTITPCIVQYKHSGSIDIWDDNFEDWFEVVKLN